ncbi:MULTISPECIES: thiolase domain-containing protein [Rhizobium/Agrobacterium group]|uniref:thiolase domain-containing protein n=1 Tax=Rhizobium/Agrobacterium group TaxID=227290 RepID=UPI000B3F6E95|nr:MULTISPECIES: thiolase domain-containing protein [Rhizobium/Agrobacterium group]MCF1483850.1 thiolase domain-containing protein [Allorhizobium ampelinum]NSZ45981.1 thiolase domain-containing protein [Agrobacterium vitis]NTA29696.1 thiolase domain-containing protein [Allorhizobium ampelinum]OVE88671.1 acetyl-CoA acetyltransferase [Allorhizobium ampelinum]
MSIRGKAFIVGAYEHPGRNLPDHSVQQIHAECAMGALSDAGLSIKDVDGYFSNGQLGFGGISMAEYLGLRLSYIDSTFTGGSSYMAHVGHAAAAIAAGKCKVALITQGAKVRGVLRGAKHTADTPEFPFETVYGETNAAIYALAARRHMHEYGTTAEQLAAVKVAAAAYAQHNPNALLRKLVSIDDVMNSPIIADPLHRLDCCVVTDGGGALVLVAPEIARSLKRQSVKLLGHAEAIRHGGDGPSDFASTAAALSGPRAFTEAGVSPRDVRYASIYDSFTITVIMTLEDLGFCAKGEGGAFVASGALGLDGLLPINTDGGGLCNNHPGYQGGMVRTIEAVRQLRGEANPNTQVKNCTIALAHGTGGGMSRHASVTLVLGQEDA